MRSNDLPLDSPQCYRWRKSSFSHPNGNECVEVRRTGDEVQVRDSKDLGHGPTLTVHVSAWARLLDDVANGTNSTEGVQIKHARDGSVRLAIRHQDALRFTPAEWIAFRKGVLSGEFDCRPVAPARTTTQEFSAVKA